MSNKISIAIIAIVLMIGVASADAPILLTTSNNPELNGIVITVTPDGANGKMAVELTSNPVINTPIGIDQFFYNLNGNCNGRSCTGDWYIVSVAGDSSGDSWGFLNKDGTTADGFGTFLSHRSKNHGGTGGLTGSPITFTLANPFITATDLLPNSEHNARMAVHIRFDQCSGWISDATGNDGTPDTDTDGGTTFGCTRPGNDIPEFPSVALPIAAVIGLLFLFQHRKNKEE